MKVLRIVLDTNALVSRLLLPASTPALAVTRAIRTGTILQSENTLAELAEVLARKKFDPYVTVEDRQEFLRLLTRISDFPEIVRRINACRDPKDDMFLELAVNGNADCLVTGDKDLLTLNPFEGIPIYTPDEFLKVDI